MANFETLEQARAHFKNDAFATGNGMVIDTLTDDGCQVSMKLDDRHKNANGGVMGGVIFTLADFAFAVACNNDHLPTVAMNVNISYLNAPKGQRLTATAARVKSGRTSCVFNVMVRDDTGRDVAMFIGTGFKL